MDLGGQRATVGLTAGPVSPAGNTRDLGGAAAEVLLCVPPGRVHGHAGQQVNVWGQVQWAPPPPMVSSSGHSPPILCSFERLLLHAICQYMDLISASKYLVAPGPQLADSIPGKLRLGLPESVHPATGIRGGGTS